MNLITEKEFEGIKAYRKIATGYKQTALNFLSLLFVCSSAVIMRSKTEDVS